MFLLSILRSNPLKIIGLIILVAAGFYLYYCHSQIKILQAQLTNAETMIRNKDQTIKNWETSYNHLNSIVDDNNEKIADLEKKRQDLIENLENSDALINQKEVLHRQIVKELENEIVPDKCEESIEWFRNRASEIGKKWESE